MANILVKPTAAWMTVCPTPQAMACVGTMLKLLCLYTKAMAAEERRPRVQGPNNYGIKTPDPKCRLYWCFIESIDWRYSQSWLVFSTPLVN